MLLMRLGCLLTIPEQVNVLLEQDANVKILMKYCHTLATRSIPGRQVLGMDGQIQNHLMKIPLMRYGTHPTNYPSRNKNALFLLYTDGIHFPTRKKMK